MKLLIALGNPGPKYKETRHNAGFLMLDLLVEREGGEWLKEQFSSTVGRMRLFGEDCWLLKPMTFMNLSGRAVAEAARFWKIPPCDWVVLHDDIDVPALKVKARSGGSAGGHNGVTSIMVETGEDQFHRLKLGVGKPPPEVRMDVAAWVLDRMSTVELEALSKEMYDETKERLRNIFKQQEAEGRAAKK